MYVQVKGIAALHTCKACALHTHYIQSPRSVHAPYTQMPENACNYTGVISRSQYEIAGQITQSPIGTH